MRQVVIDTSILIRAFLRRKSSDGEIYSLLLDKKIRVFYSEGLIKEFLRVIDYPRISKKYIFTKENIDSFLSQILLLGNIILPKKVKLCRDIKDDEILGIAMTASESGKTYLITGDEDLLILKDKVKKVIIFTPQEFLRRNNN